MKRNSSRKTFAARNLAPLEKNTKDKITFHREVIKAEDTLDIAIIGMACRFPGAEHYDQFWSNLIAGTSSISEIPKDRWDWASYFGATDTGRNKSCSKWGGFISNADKFDAAFFGVSPREAERMDPQQRLMLELAWHCIEDAGYIPAHLSGHDIGVFIGSCNYDYKELQDKYCTEIEGHTSTGTYNCIIPNRISFFFNFHGPSIAVDTACSSSLVSIQQAVNAIRSGECEAALAGGVSILATPTSYISFSKVGMLSPTGACKTFDAAADGYVRGEGGGLLLLKTLKDATQAKDRILGVIKGVAVNHGGRARSLTAPSALSQSKVITAAFKQAGIFPATVGYVESHGTGTPLGDPIEIHGLTRAFSQLNKSNGGAVETNYCGLGAVKSNIGHLEAAAGVAGVIKVLLAMKHKTLPANLNFSELNPRIHLTGSPFYILDSNRKWKSLLAADGRTLPLRAGVSSFGFGGVNSHIILEQAPPSDVVATSSTSPDRVGHPRTCLLVLSAASDVSLRRLAESYADLIRACPEKFSDICRAANTTRSQMIRRLSIVADTSDQLVAALRAYARDGRLSKGATASTVQGEIPHVGFLFTGQGSQYIGMGKELYETHPVFRKIMQQCDELLRPYLQRSLLELIFLSDQATLSQTRYTQPALFAIEYALAEMWKSFGVKPDVLMGHSVGELAAACIAGVFSLEDGLRLIVKRGELMDSLPADGCMAAVYMGVEPLRNFLMRYEITLDIAAVNAENSTVISGERETVEKTIRLLGDDGIEVRILDVSHAFHSSMVESIQSEFLEEVAKTTLSLPKIKIISNVTGAMADKELLDPHYWAGHIRKSVMFQQGVESMSDAGTNVFLEIGPTPVLTGLARRSVTRPVQCLASLNQKRADYLNVISTLGKLYSLGIDIDFRSLYEDAPQDCIQLPSYPFAGQSFWIAQASPNQHMRAMGHIQEDHDTPLLGHRLNIATSDTEYFVSYLRYDHIDYLHDHQIQGSTILPGAAYLTMAISSALRASCNSGVHDGVNIENVAFHRPLILTHDVLLQAVLRKIDTTDRYAFEIWAQSVTPMMSASMGAVATKSEIDEPWVLHASGTVSRDNSEIFKPEEAAAADIGNGAAIVFPDLYTKMNEYGLAYGPAFQGMRSFLTNNNGGTADIALPADIQYRDAYLYHPALLDAIFQSALPLLPADAFRDSLLPLPVGVSNLRLKRKLPARLTVKATVDSVDSLKGIYRCNYQIFSVEGEQLGEISDLTLMRVSPLKITSQTGSALDPFKDMFYQPMWYREPLDASIPQPQYRESGHRRGSTLLVYSSEGQALAETVAKQIDSEQLVCATIDLGPSRPAEHFYSISPDDTTEFLHIIQRYNDIDSIYFFGGFHRITEHDAHAKCAQGIDAGAEQGVLWLFRLIGDLTSHLDRGAEINLKVITNRSYAVNSGDPVIPWGAATHGLAGVYCKENSTVRLVNIDLALDAVPHVGQLTLAARQIMEEPALDQGRTVAYRHDSRYCRRLEAVYVADNGAPGYRERGVYLILGGAGGIGLTLSRYLAETYQANLVWVGRSTLDNDKTRAIAEIEGLGGQAVYFQADGCDTLALQKVVKAAVLRFGRINGAIHSALVLKDQTLRNMDLSTFRAGLDPKVRGSVALYEAVKHEPLDFIMFFSSVVAFLANRGQGNYVAGCAFKDSFASYLQNNHSIPVKVINWGRWGSVGAVASDEYSKRLESQGIRSISPQEGIEAIERILTSPASQLVAIKADRAMLEEIEVDMTSDVRWVQQLAFLDIDLWKSMQAPALALPVADGALQDSYDELNRFSGELLLHTFKEMLPGAPPYALTTAIELRSSLGIKPSYERLYRACLDILEQVGGVKVDGDVINVTTHQGATTSWLSFSTTKDSLLSKYPWLHAEVNLLWECGQKLAMILRGEIPATSVIFPNLSMELVEGVYSAGPLACYYNERIADAVVKAVLSMTDTHTDDSKIRILEIGAGTGGTSRVVLDHLKMLGITKDDRVHYVYTDISPAFLQYGKQHYSKYYPFLVFDTLDIEKPLESQGYDAGSFDIVIASNVLHATKDLSVTLQNVKGLLKRGGILVFNELIQKQNFLTLTFGLLDGWWLSTDTHKRLAHAPILTLPQWQETLREEGYARVVVISDAEAARKINYQGVILAQSDGRVRRKRQSQERLSDRGADKGKPIDSMTASIPRMSAAEVLALAQSAPQEVVHTGLLNYLRGELADVLHLRNEQLDSTNRPFPQMLLSELGMDSLTAMDLRNRLRKKMSVDIPVELLLSGSRIQEIASLAYEQLLLNRLIFNKNQADGDDTAHTRENEDREVLVL